MRYARCLLLLIGVLSFLTTICSPRLGFAQSPPLRTEALLLATINAVTDEKPIVALRDDQGRLLLSETDLRRWRVRIPDNSDAAITNAAYFDLHRWPNAKFSIDEASQQLSVTFPVDAFEPSQFESSASAKRESSAPTIGAFVSYDALTERTTAASRRVGTIELGTFSPWGIGTIRYFLDGGRDRPGAIRLETAWIRDFPSRISTLQLGDGITRAASGWGGSIRYSGIRYGTNFATRPDFVLLPTSLVAGSAETPSTVDVFVNDSLVTRKNVPTGPFSIEQIPLVTGANSLQVRVRDALGREQVYERSLFSSAQLLRPGLDDYAIEIGRARNDFGVRSNAYGAIFGSLGWRRGLTDTLTSEIHLEASSTQAGVAGVGAALALGRIGVVNFSLAQSASKIGRGTAFAASWARPGPKISLAISTQWSSPAFWQLASNEVFVRPRFLFDSIVALNLTRRGNISIGYARQVLKTPTPDNVRFLNLTWTTAVSQKIYAGLTVRRFLGASPSTNFGLVFGLSIDNQRSGSSFFQRDDNFYGNRNAAGFDFQKSLPAGPGWGYRLRADASDSFQAGSNYQTDEGLLTLELAKQTTGTATRLGVQGSVILVGGNIFASRRVSDAFALVRVPGFSGVRVYNGNQWVSTTDRRGNALVPRLVPYQQNSISIDDRDLPLDAEIERLEHTAIPVYRSGVLVDFNIKRTAGAQLRVIDIDGTPLEVGAIARLPDHAQEFRISEDGRLYLSGLTSQNLVRIERNSTVCVVRFPYQPTEDPLPDLGTFVCRETGQ